jgi:hypothetical protein
VVAAGRGDQGQVLRRDRRTGGGWRDGRRAERRDAPAQVRRQHLLELDEGAHRGLLDARHGRAGGGEEAYCDRDRLLVVEQQRRHRGSGLEPVPARRAGERLDRIPELAQPLDVAADRPAGHRQALGELGAGPVAASREEGQELQESARGRRHGGCILSTN